MGGGSTRYLHRRIWRADAHPQHGAPGAALPAWRRVEWPPASTARVGRQGVCAHGVYGLGAARHADQWWSMLERGVFMAVGFHRQILLVMPRHGIAAAVTGRKHWAFAPWMICWIARPKLLMPFQPALPARPVPLLRDEGKLQPSAAWVPTTTDCGPSPAGCEIRSSMMKVR